MTCVAPSNELFNTFQAEQQRYMTGWARKQCMEDFSSDEESIIAIKDKQQNDRLKEIHDLNMRATLLNTEAYRHSDESTTQNNRKRLFSEYNSPEHRPNSEQPEEGRNKLTLSQFATSASEQEPLYPDEEDVEEILMRLRHGHDYCRPKASPSTPPTLPSILFTPPTGHNHSHMSYPSYYHMENSRPSSSHSAPNKASLYHILSQETDSVQNNNTTLPSMSVHMRKYFEDVMDADEQGLEHPRKKARKELKTSKSPLKSFSMHGNDEVLEKEVVASGLCFKTHKPKVQREYYYAKLSKTIFRWTCCGSQAKTHPDA